MPLYENVRAHTRSKPTKKAGTSTKAKAPAKAKVKAPAKKTESSYVVELRERAKKNISRLEKEIKGFQAKNKEANDKLKIAKAKKSKAKTYKEESAIQYDVKRQEGLKKHYAKEIKERRNTIEKVKKDL